MSAITDSVPEQQWPDDTITKNIALANSRDLVKSASKLANKAVLYVCVYLLLAHLLAVADSVVQ